jgi:hypothetical protein
MPRKLSRLQRLLTGVGIGALIAVASPAAAGASVLCEPEDGAVSQAFARWGDRADYFLAPGGDFEGPLSWAGTRTPTIVDGNEPFMLTGFGSHSLQLGSGDTVTTPKLCVTRALPHLRFLARSYGGQLDVKVDVYTSTGKVTDSSNGSVSSSDHRSWQPSDPILLKTDKLRTNETGHVTITFKASSGTWLIDDVLIDPYRR